MLHGWINLVQDSLRVAGPLSYLILIVFAGSVILVLERTVRLYWHCPGASRPLQDLIRLKEPGQPLEMVLSRLPTRARSLQVRLVRATLTGAQRSPQAAADALSEAMTALPRLPFQRLHMLRSFAWLAVVLGALTTLFGLVFRQTTTFCCMATPEQKDALLTRRFSEALNGTSHGFITALFCHLAWTTLHRRAQRLVDDLELTAVALANRLELEEVPMRRYLLSGDGRRRFASARATQVEPQGRRVPRIHLEGSGYARTSPLAPQMDQPATSQSGPLPGLGALPFILIGLLAQLRVYTTSPAVFLHGHLGLPVSNSALPLKEAITIQIDEGWLEVDDRKVAEGFGERLNPAQLEALEALLRNRAGFKAKIESLEGPPFEWNLLLAADRKVPYGLLEQVIVSATKVGFKDLQLAVYSPL